MNKKMALSREGTLYWLKNQLRDADNDKRLLIAIAIERIERGEDIMEAIIHV